MPSPAERPSKICPVCGRPFQWRRRWKQVWDEVRYCSERCRRRRSAAAAAAEPGAAGTAGERRNSALQPWSGPASQR